MSDDFIELNAGSGGKKIDAEALVVSSQNVVRERHQIAGAADTEIARVDDVALANAAFGLAVRPITQRIASVQQFFDGTATSVLNATTSRNSSGFDCSPYSKAVAYLEYVRANTPTLLRLKVEFSDDGGSSWHEARALTTEFTDVAQAPTSTPGTRVSLEIPFLGRRVRFTIEGEGTTASNTITVLLDVEFL